MGNYGWQQLSQWDMREQGVYTTNKNVDTGLSKALCTFILVRNVDTGNGGTRFYPVNENDVTPEMLEIAGDC